MPVRPRATANDRGGGPCLRVGTLTALGALAAVGYRAVVVHSFVVPRAISGLDPAGVGAPGAAPAAVTATPCAASARVVSKRRGQRHCELVGRGIGKGSVVLLRASMDDDDDDEFDANIYDEELSGYDEEEDDMGMGVSSTIKNKKPARPKPEEVFGSEERENVILELASAAQEVADSLLPEDSFDKYKRKETVAPEDDDGLGMGVSGTRTPPQRRETFGDGDMTDKAVAAMQGAEQILEMERMASKDMQRGQMEDRGLSAEQISAYIGDDPAVAPRSKAEQVAARTLEAYQKAAFEDSSAWRKEDALLQVAPSSQLVKTDEKGDPYQDRFVYVDEYTCIGCTHCSHTAPSTFFMEDEHGRARVYQQGRDTDEAVRDAILTCPVDCIHYVDWPELTRLETEREGVEINFKARLVGNNHDSAKNGQQLISGNQGMRCENCPSRGCYKCPMFGVGDNPEYAKRKVERKLKRQERLKKDQEDLTGEVRVADL